MKNIFDKRFYYKEINKKDWKGKKKKKHEIIGLKCLRNFVMYLER